METTQHQKVKALQHLSGLLNEFNIYFSSENLETSSEEFKQTLSEDFELHKELSLKLDERTQILGGDLKPVSDTGAQWITMIKGISSSRDPQDLYKEVKTYIIQRYEEYREKLDSSETRDLIHSQSTDFIYSFEQSKNQLKAAA